MSDVLRESQPGELPPLMGIKEIAIARPNMPTGVVQEPPLKTNWPDMNLPLYSPTAPPPA